MNTAVFLFWQTIAAITLASFHKAALIVAPAGEREMVITLSLYDDSGAFSIMQSASLQYRPISRLYHFKGTLLFIIASSLVELKWKLITMSDFGFEKDEGVVIITLHSKSR